MIPPNFKMNIPCCATCWNSEKEVTWCGKHKGNITPHCVCDDYDEIVFVEG